MIVENELPGKPRVNKQESPVEAAGGRQESLGNMWPQQLEAAREYFSDHWGAQRACAREIGVSEASLSLWLRGHSRPSYRNRLRLFNWLAQKNHPPSELGGGE